MYVHIIISNVLCIRVSGVERSRVADPAVKANATDLSLKAKDMTYMTTTLSLHSFIYL